MELKIKSIKKLISEKMVQDYAEVSGDFNPIHLDEDYARETEFKNKIVHGMLLISNITEIMVKNFGNSWSKNGALKIKFRNPLPVNSNLVTNLKIKKFDKSLEYISKWVKDLNEPTYPPQIVEHKMARERCLTKYKAALNPS